MNYFKDWFDMIGKYFLIILFLFIIICALTGCSPSNNEKAVDECIKKGGVPFLSDWNGNLERCELEK